MKSIVSLVESAPEGKIDSLLSDFDESITSHVLNTLVSLVSELEELVDDSLEELPVSFEESRVLTNNVHDI